MSVNKNEPPLVLTALGEMVDGLGMHPDYAWSIAMFSDYGPHLLEEIRELQNSEEGRAKLDQVKDFWSIQGQTPPWETGLEDEAGAGKSLEDLKDEVRQDERKQ